MNATKRPKLIKLNATTGKCGKGRTRETEARLSWFNSSSSNTCHADRDSERQADREGKIEKDRQTERERESEISRQGDRQRDRQRDRHWVLLEVLDSPAENSLHRVSATRWFQVLISVARNVAPATPLPPPLVRFRLTLNGQFSISQTTCKVGASRLDAHALAVSLGTT